MRKTKKMRLRPLGSRVIIQRDEPEEVKGGVIIPDTAQKETERGVIVAVNEKDPTRKVAVGDRVIYSHYAGSLVKATPDEFLIVKEVDLLAIENV
jgi:chaperonin GroES